MRLVLDLQGAAGGTEGNEEARIVADEFIRVYDLYVKKNQTYRGAWRQQGWMGNLGRILSKASRMRAMMWRDNAFAVTLEEEESAEDNAMDIINLCVFFLINGRTGNKWGDRA